MSNYEQKNGQGIIFKNDRKSADNQPDYTGNFTGLDGKKYNAALWVKEGKNGKKFFSFSQSEFKEKSSKDIPF